MRCLLDILTALVLLINIRILSRSSISVQEIMIGDAPLTVYSFANATATAIDASSSAGGTATTRIGVATTTTTTSNTHETEGSRSSNTLWDGIGSLLTSTMSQQGGTTKQLTSSIAGKDDPNTFAACLQIMDDNHFLIEWISYHYHAMPLRRLIVLVDPNSRSSPQPILDRWNDRMEITVVNDTFVYPGGGQPFSLPKLDQHRHRQRQFVRRCLQEMHKTKGGWVFLTDTDEYVMINDRVRNASDPLSPVMYAGKELPIPGQEEPGSVMKFLQMEGTLNPHTNQTLATIPCLTIARKTFGTNEGEGEPDYNMGFNPRDFQTFLWDKYGGEPKPGKSIINLNYFQYDDILPRPSIHRPGSDEICKGKMWIPEDLSVIIANHYPGTLEQMLFRFDDARGSDKQFRNATKYRIQRFEAYKAMSTSQDSGTIKKWLKGFIDSVGEEEAKRLLQYVGRPEEASHLDATALAASPADSVISSASSQQTTQLIDATGLERPTQSARSSSSSPLFSSIAAKDDPNTFAGCLLLMDDNHFAIEWIAYHYHVLPLRRLIVLTDPLSQTSPSHILERWADRMHITLWNENHVFPDGPSAPLSKHKKQTRAGRHRGRQRRFIKLCLRALHKENRRWTVLTDTDEYTMINNRLRNREDKLSPLSYSTSKNLEIPSQREPGSVMKLVGIEDVVLSTGQHLFDNPCITMARKTFGTRANHTELIEGYNSSDFQTLNWRYYVDSQKFGKTLVNLAYVKYKDIPFDPSVHRPFHDEDICAGKIALSERVSPLVVNHYPGNLRQMLFRSHDSRGEDFDLDPTTYRLQRFQNFTNFDKRLENEVIREWLPGFIDSVGQQEAQRLLEYVGNPDLAAGRISENATLRSPPVIEIGKPSEQNDASRINKDVTVFEQSSQANPEIGSASAVPPVSREDPNAFSSCVMVNGDFKLLIEWIAYHYHVMPLRRLILLEDPRRQPVPSELLERWRGFMDITYWNKGHFDLGSITGDEVKQTKTMERTFIRRCLKTLHKEGREWVFLTAIDEYTMINDLLRDANNEISPLSKAGHHLPLPAASAPSSVLQLLRREDVEILHTEEIAKDSACITMARKTFSNKEASVPMSPLSGLDGSNFQTIKWRYYTDDGKAGRSLLDLSKIALADIAVNPSPNRPLDNVCKGKLRLFEGESIVVVNRYKQDPEELKSPHLEKETIQAWLPGFVASVGEGLARELLAPVQPVAAAAT